MKIKVYVSVGLVGCKRTETIELEDDGLSDEAIEEIAKEWLNETIEWGWKKVEEP